jgi:hypothetical protein
MALRREMFCCCLRVSEKLDRGKGMSNLPDEACWGLPFAIECDAREGDFLG